MEELLGTLDEIIELLAKAGESRWLPVLQGNRKRLFMGPVQAKRQILGIFGGMGSFNDLVLFDGRRVLVKENEVLDTLRSKLFDLSKP